MPSPASTWDAGSGIAVMLTDAGCKLPCWLQSVPEFVVAVVPKKSTKSPGFCQPLAFFPKGSAAEPAFPVNAQRKDPPEPVVETTSQYVDPDVSATLPKSNA